MWASNKWYDVGSYRFEDDAKINRTLAEKQALEAKWRVIKKEEK